MIIQRLYDLGPRRILVTGSGPLGCVPAELAQHSRNGECAAELMKAAGLFNPQLVQMLDQLNQEIGSDVFVAANTNQMHLDFISNPQQFGMFFHLNLKKKKKASDWILNKMHTSDSTT